MSQPISKTHPLHQLFDGLVEQAFMTELGICDVALTDYLSALLIDFIHIDHIYRLRSVDGAAIRNLSQMQTDAMLTEAADASQRTRLIHKHIGDFTLFWTGVYPETLMRRRSGADLMREYLLQGKQSYTIASGLSRPGAVPPGAVLRCLGEQFEYCVQGLHLVRESWERLRDAPNTGAGAP